MINLRWWTETETPSQSRDWTSVIFEFVSRPGIGSATNGVRDSRLRIVLMLSSIMLMGTLPPTIAGQSMPYAESSPTVTVIPPSNLAGAIYLPPTERQKLKNFAFDAFGPLALASAGFQAGVDQYDNSPPEWRQGMKGFARRFGSDFGVTAVTTTARYGLSETLREDSLYYRCECVDLLPRLRHATFSTFTARRGRDGHRVFSVPAVLAPYIGAATATYGWYPDRFGAKDAFRLGNYTLLANVGGNVAREFIYGGPHSLLARIHPNNAHVVTDPGMNP